MFPFILLVGLAVYAGSRYAAAHTNEARVASSGAPRGRRLGDRSSTPPGDPPGPIAVLGEFLRRGQEPPPPVIMCAIAEAEMIGRNDLAHDIVRVFIAPVVYRDDFARARNANVVSGGAPAQAPVYAPPMAPPPSPNMPAYMPGYPPAQQSAMERARAARQMAMDYASAPRADEPLPVLVPAAQAQPMPGATPQPQPMPGQPTDDELIAQMLGQAGVPAPVQPVPAPSGAVPVVTAGEVSFSDVPRERERVRVPARRHSNTGEITVLDANGRPIGQRYSPPSPIPAISDATWAAFADRLARENPLYQSSRHVGQYRHRRERLAELGIDPSSLVGVPAAQRAALDIDMADNYHHAREGGMISENIRRLIRVPGVKDPCTVTLSGILGVIQCAGLESAYQWFENQQDRVRFTYTTKMFLNTNGEF